MSVSIATLLSDTEDCIQAVLRAGQSYSLVLSRTVTRADLEQLWDLRRKLKAEALADAYGRPVVASADMTGNW